MKKEIIQVDEKNQIVRVTTVDERWYFRPKEDKGTGLPAYEYVPSVTWIAEHYPKGIGFYKWLANKGWDEAEALKEAAADKGSKVHQAICSLIDGNAIKIDAKFLNPTTNQGEDLTFEEYECILSFVEWFKKVKPLIVKREFVVWGDGFAGTIDMLCEIDGETYIVDLKTSRYIWPSHELQLSAYKNALGYKEDPKLAILQLGYQLNKNKFKFTDIEDCFDLFLAARKIWERENKDKQPAQKDYPLEVKL